MSLAYSDGFGRVIQSKVQAEPGPVGDDGANVSPRWTTNGWSVFNNKGNPVRQYEPFFSSSHSFEFAVTVGVSPTLFYDPVGRVVATLHPDHTWEKVIFDPWRQESHDVNDTVLTNPGSDTDVSDFSRRLRDGEYPAHLARAAYRSRACSGSVAAGPTISGGRMKREPLRKRRRCMQAHRASRTSTQWVVPSLSVADNGLDGQFPTRTEYDIEGNPLTITDARGNIVMAYHVES